MRAKKRRDNETTRQIKQKQKYKKKERDGKINTKQEDVKLEE